MKKKLRLEIEKLSVEQFDAQPNSPVARGTVHGFDSHYSYSEPDRCICQPMPGSQHLYFSDCC